MKRALLFAAALLGLVAFALYLGAAAVVRECAAADRAFRSCRGLRVVGTVSDSPARLCVEGR